MGKNKYIIYEKTVAVVKVVTYNSFDVMSIYKNIFDCLIVWR